MVCVAPMLLIYGAGGGDLVGDLVVKYFIKPNFPPASHGDL